MASRGSYIRSAARATFSAYRSIPIRWRLAGGSAMLTCVILASFAAIVGVLTDRDLRGQFNNEVRSNSDQLAKDLHLKWLGDGAYLNCKRQNVSLKDYTSAEHAQIRIFNEAGVLLCTQEDVKVKGVKALPATPEFPAPIKAGTYNEGGYLVVAQQLTVAPSTVWLLYARPLSDVDHTVARVQVILLLGVLGGTVLALLGGLATAARAMRPIVQLTGAAREIQRTRDPRLRLPVPEADDEVAELARTVEGMLGSLDAARGETHAALERQREFVADASHELRTPLTSLLANLELLAEELDGDQADTAEAALRSARRMRRLVGDLLLLARADARRSVSRGPTDLADVLLEAASELGPMAEDHDLSIDARPAVVPGVRDDLHRLTLNLIENAVRHTPPGTHIRASHRRRERRRAADRRRRRPRNPTRARRPRVRSVRARLEHRNPGIGPRARDRPGGRRIALGLGRAGAAGRRHRDAIRDHDPPRRHRPTRGPAARDSGRRKCEAG